MAETLLERKDAMLDFGSVSSTASENKLYMGDSPAAGMDVVFTATEGGSATVVVKSSDTEGGSYAAIAQSAATTVAAGDTVRVTIPRGDKSKYLMVTCGVAGTAVIDTHVGI